MIMRKYLTIYFLAASNLISLGQIVGPHGEGSVVFGSAGGKWQKAFITDQSSGESSTAYSLDAESAVVEAGTTRHPRIVFSCQRSGEFDGVWIRTDTIVANRPYSVIEYPSGWSQISTPSNNSGGQSWTTSIASNGSDFVADQKIISSFIAHKRFVIRFVSASGETITDEYVTNGLSIKSLKTECPSLFSKK